MQYSGGRKTAASGAVVPVVWYLLNLLVVPLVGFAVLVWLYLQQRGWPSAAQGPYPGGDVYVGDRGGIDQFRGGRCLAGAGQYRALLVVCAGVGDCIAHGVRAVGDDCNGSGDG